jgi:protein-S-isoprenylcysteine O-methyltransferase Ste14
MENLLKYRIRSVAKAALLNIGLVIIVVLIDLLLLFVDKILSIPNMQSSLLMTVGIGALMVGLFFRVWAAYTFYQSSIKVLAILPQNKLVVSGPYRISRNPLHIGIVCVTLGMALIMGSPSGVIFAIFTLISFDIYVCFFDESRLRRVFGEPYINYKKSTPRWI